MPSCSTLVPLVSPYVDGELAAADREALERHIAACSPCRARVATERAVRELVTSQRAGLKSTGAPRALHARCTAACKAGRVEFPALHAGSFQPTSFRARLWPLTLAASLIVIVGAAFLYPLTARSSRVLAAELAVDHMKC